MSLYKFDRTLAETSTPDWVLYCRAAEAGFDALVTRDQSQISQPVEMYVLSRLHHFTIVTWKKSVEDPIREWGQLLAYPHASGRDPFARSDARCAERGPRR